MSWLVMTKQESEHLKPENYIIEGDMEGEQPTRTRASLTTMASTTILLLSSLVFLLQIVATTATIQGSNRGPFSKIFAFGDSFTDTGNTHSTTGPIAFGHVSSPPYGATFFHHSTNRYSDGRLVVDFLAKTLSLPFLQPYLNKTADFSNGVNFAVAGSTALDHEFFVKNNISIDITPQSLGTQLEWFDKYLEGKGCRRGIRTPECRRLMEESLFWVGEIGVNDYAYSTGSSVEPDTVRTLAIDNVTNFLQKLLKRGAKYMVVQGQPMAGCLPLTMYLVSADDRDKLGCSAKANQYSQTYNKLLQSKLRDLRRSYPHSVISYADYFAAHHAVMSNPAAHGFTEPFKVCCGSGGGTYNFDFLATCGSPEVKACADPTRYVNWDGVHLTEAMYKVVADLFFNNGYCHPQFQFLVSSKLKGS